MRAVVLLSGGLDSTVCLKKTVDERGASLALTFDYGQKAARKEISSARRICKKLQVKHQAVNLPWLGGLGQNSLVTANSRIPEPAPDAAPEALQKAADSVWVPNRNGVFVNIAAAYAEALGLDTVVVGFNRDEAEYFPDNSVQYMAAANAALRFSTKSGIELVSYTAYLSKKEVARLGRAIGAPLDLIWYCYQGGRQPCRRCQSCITYRRATEKLK
jgi:7-cyano-7-deazaguanine synthase